MTEPCATPERCAFIPIFAERPTETSDKVITDFRSAKEIQAEEIIDAYTRMLSETRERVTDGMACTRCGKILRDRGVREGS